LYLVGHQTIHLKEELKLYGTNGYKCFK
jgi:hypothetical protein